MNIISICPKCNNKVQLIGEIQGYYCVKDNILIFDNNEIIEIPELEVMSEE